jgi:hypothetical protein
MTKFLSSLPSTNFRIFVTMGLVSLVILRYIISGAAIGEMHFDKFQPDWDVLMFLAVLAGIDLAQFHLKRKTEPDYLAANQPQVTVKTANVKTDEVTLNTATGTVPAAATEPDD